MNHYEIDVTIINHHVTWLLRHDDKPNGFAALEKPRMANAVSVDCQAPRDFDAQVL